MQCKHLLTRVWTAGSAGSAMVSL